MRVSVIFDTNSLGSAAALLLPLFAEGLQSHEIAERLCISKNTVDRHRQNIMAKLGKRSVTELAAYYHGHIKPQQS